MASQRPCPRSAWGFCKLLKKQTKRTPRLIEHARFTPPQQPPTPQRALATDTIILDKLHVLLKTAAAQLRMETRNSP
jgi:hypothetical protein